MSKRYYLCNLIPLWKIDLGHLEVDWAKEKALNGEIVEMRVVVKLPLNLQQPSFSVQFDINESDYLLFGGWDDHVTTIGSKPGEKVEHRPLRVLGETDPVPIAQRLQRIFVSPIPTQSGRPWTLIRAYWLAEWQADVSGEPEYFFDFKLLVPIADAAHHAPVAHEERSDRELTVSSKRLGLIHSETFRGFTHKPQRGAIEHEATRSLSFSETEHFGRRRLYETLRRGNFKGLVKEPMRTCKFESPPGDPLRECDFEDLADEVFCKDCKAFTLNLGIDRMPWDEKCHRLREMNPYVWVTISDDSLFTPPDIERPRWLNMGTDLFDDVYFDTPDFICLDNGISIRARKRWPHFHIGEEPDLPGLLIGVKFTRPNDPLTGLKRDRKLDRRIIRATKKDIDSLILDVQNGYTNWSVDFLDEQGTLVQRPGPLAELKEVYDELASKELLPDIDPYKDVLALEPKVLLRSLRSRFHFMEASLGDMRELHRLGTERLKEFRGIFHEAMKKGSIASALRPGVEVLVGKIDGALDHSLIAERAFTQLQEIDPAIKEITDSIILTDLTITSLLPDSDVLRITDLVLENMKSKGIDNEIIKKLGGMKNQRFTQEKEFWKALRKIIGEDLTAVDVPWLLDHARNPIDGMAAVPMMKVIAQVISDLYHELAREIDSFLKSPSNQPRSIIDAERFIEWQRSFVLLRLITTFDTFTERHMEILNLPPSVKQKRLDAFNKFGEDQKAAGLKLFRNFEPLNVKEFEEIAEQLLYGKLEIWKRQVEAAGSAMLGLWFDASRRRYVPASSRITESLRDIETDNRIRNEHFLIDTTDLTGMFTPDAWGDRPVSEQTSEHEPELEKLFHATLINEVQIELFRSIPYEERLRSLVEEIESREDTDPEIMALEENLKGTRFVFDQYLNILGIIADLKLDGVQAALSGPEGARDIRWEGMKKPMSKGETALKILKQRVPL